MRYNPKLLLRPSAARTTCTALLALALAACGAKPVEVPVSEPLTIGISTSLPLLWSESGDIRGQLAQQAPAHWASGLLDAKGQVAPLDTLADAEGRLPLPQDALLVLAQPQALTPQENVALDAWVRGGGRLLLFADPMLTSHSAFPLGDPRRPQAIAMLSPILRHWGLELEFDADQPSGERLANAYGVQLPVDLPGRFRIATETQCRPEADALVVECAIGEGRVLAVGDAALFDGDDAGRAAALDALIDRITR
ncbi:DUF4350 domain-containing protein [Novosphingobium sp. RD2P27]|uniref:DUF4350 domain-containing protein n=1 Tax=Novosphingobium kalidii TaxID=3230299 RepID=A0ABV2D0T2_9SPHN